jgi:hypothetical protein
MAPLELEAAADLKLAITEAATFLMGGDRRSAAREDDDIDASMNFSFDLQDSAIVVEVRGSDQRTFSEEERELSRAIIDATVDECEYDGGTMRLRKRLGLPGE